MPEFETTIEFEVYCGTCGAGLCGQSVVQHGSRGWRVDVEACKSCMDDAKDAGYAKAMDELEEA